ncbi:lipoprotein LipO [Spirochaetia bacterium]|nr:lipoprotein LipO [Spirochaetia bacterium]
MKKTIISMMVLFPVLLLFAACGAKTQADNAAYVSKGKADPLAKYSPEITMTSVRTMSPTDKFDKNDPDQESYEKNRWMRVYKEDLGINIKWNWIAPDEDSALARWNTSIAANDIPDFAYVGNNVYKQLYDADLIADMKQIFADYATDELKATLLPSDYDMLTFDGQMLGFPAGRKQFAGTTMLFVRQDWLEKVGLQLPETIDDVVKIAKAFKDAKLGGSDTIGIIFSNNLTGGSNFGAADGKWDGFVNGFGGYLNYWVQKGGALEYSYIQPEVREALVYAQKLYKDGIINLDFASLTPAQAREYVASGKCGIFYSTAWNVTQSMNTLVKDQKARMVNLMSPPAKAGQKLPVQTNYNGGMRTFVSRKSKNPEAAVKLANISYAYKFKDWHYYMIGNNDEAWYKYLAWGDFFAPAEDDLKKSFAMAEAELTGKPIEDPSWAGEYNMFKTAVAGQTDPWPTMLYGPKGDYTTLYNAYLENRLLVDVFQGLPTNTLELKGNVLRTALEAAFFEVVMGADISTWDRAVEAWKRDGGTQISSEVNEWYKGLSK